MQGQAQWGDTAELMKHLLPLAFIPKWKWMEKVHTFGKWEHAQKKKNTALPRKEDPYLGQQD